MKKKIELNCHTCSGRSKSIFCKLEKAEVDVLNSAKNANVYKKGQNIFIEGNPPFGLYCVHNGKIKVTKMNSEGRETIVRFASSGDVLGHRSMFSDSPYTASATVIEDAVVCFVSKKTVHEMIQKDPSLSFEIISHISRQMGVAEEKLASMAQKSVRERFAEALLLLKEAFGIAVDQGIKIDIKLTRDELASMVGAASENLIRLVSEFKSDGILTQEGKNLVITDLPQLEKIACFEH